MTDIPHKVHTWIKKDTLIRSLVFIALIALVIGEVTVLIQDFYLSPQPSSTQTDTTRTIEPWMTFGYINILFNLPANYLQTTLAIDDPRYPNTEIRRYAKEHGIDQALFIQTITEAIDRYGSH